jgi:hypothetical protein
MNFQVLIFREVINAFRVKLIQKTFNYLLLRLLPEILKKKCNCGFFFLRLTIKLY